MLEHLMLEVVRQTVGVGHRHIGVDLDADISEQAMSMPARLDVKDLADAFHMRGRVPDLVGDGGFDAIEHPDKHRLG